MAIGLHKDFHNRKSIFEIRNLILFEQFAELFLFLLVQCLQHGAYLNKTVEARSRKKSRLLAALCRPRDGIGATRTRTAGPRLGADPGIGRLTRSAACDGVVGGGQDSLQVAGTAMGTDHFHLFLLIHYQHFHVFVTIHALEFKYGHLDLLM
jgi:hypothetical protein